MFVLSLYLHFIRKLKSLQKFLSIQKYYINDKEWKDSDEYNYLLERVSNHGCRKWKNDFVEFKLFLLCKCKSNWKDGVSFKIQMAQVPCSRSWRKEHLSCTATTYEHLKIDSTKTVYTSCVLHCEYNFDGLCYVQNKKRSCTFLSNKRFTWEGQKLSWNWDVSPTPVQLKVCQFPAKFLRQLKRDPSVKLDFFTDIVCDEEYFPQHFLSPVLFLCGYHVDNSREFHLRRSLMDLTNGFFVMLSDSSPVMWIF